MKVLVAGATGAIGTRLVPLLIQRGYTVIATTRDPARAERLRAGGAEPAVMDGLRPEEVLAVARRTRPDVIIHELTAIPRRFDLRRFDRTFAATNRLRIEGTDALLAAARAVGVRRFIAQSYGGWPYARTGGWVKTETDPLMESAEPAMRESLRAIKHVETAVVGERGLEGFVLRYGGFYGPGTSLGDGGSVIDEVRARRWPIVGSGAGHWSFLHIDDAAAATLAAVEAREPGIYNVADDEPAPVSEWLPFLAAAVGARPPRRIPAWLGRLVIGEHGVAFMTAIRGISNRKAKERLGWAPRWTTWREGFRFGLADAPTQAPRRAEVSR